MMTTIKMAAYTSALNADLGYRWIWASTDVTESDKVALYAVASSIVPRDVEQIHNERHIHGGIVLVPSGGIGVFRFLNGGRDAIKREGRLFICAGFAEPGTLPDVESIFWHSAFATVSDDPPASQSITVSSIQPDVREEMMNDLKTHLAAGETIPVDLIVAASLLLQSKAGTILVQVDGNQGEKLGAQLKLLHGKIPRKPPGKPGRENIGVLRDRWEKWKKMGIILKLPAIIVLSFVVGIIVGVFCMGRVDQQRNVSETDPTPSAPNSGSVHERDGPLDKIVYDYIENIAKTNNSNPTTIKIIYAYFVISGIGTSRDCAKARQIATEIKKNADDREIFEIYNKILGTQCNDMAITPISNYGYRGQ